MNAFYEHHKDSIRFGYRCFDRLLLNGLIQPFQQPERVIGFFNSYRQQYPVSRDVLHEVATQFQNWVVNRSQKWNAPILETPEDRRDKFLDPYFRNAKPNQVVAMRLLIRKVGTSNSPTAMRSTISDSNPVARPRVSVASDHSMIVTGYRMRGRTRSTSQPPGNWNGV